MNMNKISKCALIFIFSFFLFSLNSFAATTTTSVNCNALGKKACQAYGGKCRWMSGTCQEQYVAQSPCSDKNIRTVLRLAGYALKLATIAIPIILIVLGTIDLYKAVVDKDEKMFSKQIKVFLIRVAIGIFVFFIPTITKALFSLDDNINVTEDNEYKLCEICLLEPSKCDISN